MRLQVSIDAVFRKYSNETHLDTSGEIIWEFTDRYGDHDCFDIYFIISRIELRQYETNTGSERFV